MGHNDHLEDAYPDLPPHAGEQTPNGFEIDEGWLQKADRELQRAALRAWFLSRYQDPAMDTPHNSGEGGYLYIHGGPYDAQDELDARFGDLLPEDLIDEAVEDIESNGIQDWAPINPDGDEDYDDRFSLEVQGGSEPLQKLKQRLQKAQQVLTLQGSPEAQWLAQQLVFSSTIGILEAFLYETAYFWIDTDEKVLRDLVSSLPAFREQKISLADLFKRHANIKVHVKGHLQNLVWHRWDKVASIFKCGLAVQMPSTQAFEAPLIKRHHIVHRSGHDSTGVPVTVTAQEISDLCAKIEAFAHELEQRIGARDSGISDRAAPA